jgi:hypothetical protein
MFIFDVKKAFPSVAGHFKAPRELLFKADNLLFNICALLV